MLLDGGQEKREREERREGKGVVVGTGSGGGVTIELSTHTRPPLVTCVGLGRKKGEDACTHVREHTHEHTRTHTQRTKRQLF